MTSDQTTPAAPRATDVKFSEDQSGGAFFIERDDRRIAELTFKRVDGGNALLDHTFVAPELRGQGVARTLLDATVEWARRTHTPLVPQCSYAVAEFKRDTSISDVLA